MRSLILSILVLTFLACNNTPTSSTNTAQKSSDSHAGHDHAGHDHSGHDHSGHNHGHDHSGHNHNHGADDPALKYVDLDVEKSAAVAASGTIQLFDVRSLNELQADPRIPGARNSDFNGAGFKNYLNKLPKDKPYLVYCKSGNRSAKACKLMKEMGFKSVYNMLGGYDEYKRMGYLEF